MTNLVTMKDRQAVTSSLQVAMGFEKQHKHVIEAIETKIQSVENSAHYKLMFAEGEYSDSRGRQQRIYFMNRDGFAFIAMGFTGRKADDFKLKYISAFNEMENSLKTQISTQYQIPTKLSEALRLAADLEEQNEQLQLENTILKPKALFADTVSTSHTSILVGELAKLIKQNGIDVGPNRLFIWLRKNNYLIKRKGTDWNMPTQKAMELRLFEIKETVINRSNGDISISKTVKVTGKGQQYFINKFLSHELQLA